MPFFFHQKCFQVPVDSRKDIFLQFLMSFSNPERNYVFLSATHDSGSYSKNREGAEEMEMPGGTFPLAWTRSFGSGKVFVTLLGHDGLSHQNSGFQQLVLNGVDWAGS